MNLWLQLHTYIQGGAVMQVYSQCLSLMAGLLRSESLRQASGTQAQVLALLSLTELQRFKPRLKEWRLCPFVPFIYIPTQQGPYYSQPSGKYHSQGWTIVRLYELVTAPSYINTRKCRHANWLPRSSHIHDHKGAYARAYATIQPIFIVNPVAAVLRSVHRNCNRLTTIAT